MRTNNTTPVRSQAAELNTQLLQLNHSLKRNLFVLMNKSIIPKINQNKFAVPSKLPFGAKNTKANSLKATSVSTEANSSKTENSKNSKNSENSNFLAQTAKFGSGDKKFKAIYSMLLAFEEGCIVTRTIDTKKLREMRFYTRKYFGMLLNNLEAIKLQHSDALGLAILLHSAIKIGLSKTEFISNASKVGRRKNLSVNYIRKTKCYSVVKALIKNEKKCDYLEKKE